MKRRAIHVVLVVAVLAVCATCARTNESAGSAEGTQTIAPAAAQPAAPTGTDAMTDTVDIEDSRSEAEGGTSSVRVPSTGKAPKVKTDTTSAEKATQHTKSRPPGRTQ